MELEKLEDQAVIVLKEAEDGQVRFSSIFFGLTESVQRESLKVDEDSTPPVWKEEGPKEQTAINSYLKDRTLACANK